MLSERQTERSDDKPGRQHIRNLVRDYLGKMICNYALRIKLKAS